MTTRSGAAVRPSAADRAAQQAAAREAYLQRVVDSIPPITPAQRACITTLLQPRTTSVADPAQKRDLPTAS